MCSLFESILEEAGIEAGLLLPSPTKCVSGLSVASPFLPLRSSPLPDRFAANVVSLKCSYRRGIATIGPRSLVPLAALGVLGMTIHRSALPRLVPQRSQTLANLAHQDLRLLPGREVPAFVDSVVMN